MGAQQVEKVHEERQGKTRKDQYHKSSVPRGIFFEDRVDGCHCSKWVHERWTLRRRAQAAWRSLHAAFAARGFKVKPRSAVTKLTSMVTVTGNGVFICFYFGRRGSARASTPLIVWCGCVLLLPSGYGCLEIFLLVVAHPTLALCVCFAALSMCWRSLQRSQGTCLTSWLQSARQGIVPNNAEGGWHHKDGTA